MTLGFWQYLTRNTEANFCIFRPGIIFISALEIFISFHLSLSLIHFCSQGLSRILLLLQLKEALVDEVRSEVNNNTKWLQDQLQSKDSEIQRLRTEMFLQNLKTGTTRKRQYFESDVWKWVSQTYRTYKAFIPLFKKEAVLWERCLKIGQTVLQSYLSFLCVRKRKLEWCLKLGLADLQTLGFHPCVPRLRMTSLLVGR